MTIIIQRVLNALYFSPDKKYCIAHVAGIRVARVWGSVHTPIQVQ